MEVEVNLLRRRYLDSVQSNKSMKQLIKVQKDKSRQLIVACAYKLQEKEAEIKNVSLGPIGLWVQLSIWARWALWALRLVSLSFSGL